MDIAEIQSIKQRFGIIGNSPKLNRAIEVASMVANKDTSVLITGESGSGKESFSKIIHQLSHRKHGEFIAINCGAIPEGTINSELFGHEKGAFTGASDSRKGYFEVTDKGTIFLDEVAEMPLETQARLLRVLENGEFIRVGSNKVRKTDVRVVAATNVDLQERVQNGKFREDLYYRFAVPIEVPPLRERGADVELLFRKFASDFADANRTKPIILDDEAKAMLLNFRFPGNIRQLKNIVDQISVLETNRFITAETLSGYLPHDQVSRLPVLLNSKGNNGGGGADNFSEREILYKVLFDMKKDMADLKKLVLSMLQDDTTNKEVYQEHSHLFNDLGEHTFPKPSPSSSLLLESHKSTEQPTEKTFKLDESIEDITHKMEDESLSLEKKEEELIRKALIKNNNKRKYAAKDLGISERTLYRKIKQYGIDE
ncbi:sigma 54-interacting transcriptional regulator [Flexithrix dorotheae]|uniref:sigma 54-interacting transcriptional regulator n=1 Tax=Flexithrix dorotheae TaxID=70993 RepID=UPI00036E22A0|nr:sigma-54 dependent transcriptional regulator [Flexithrix dorotheae]